MSIRPGIWRRCTNRVRTNWCCRQSQGWSAYHGTRAFDAPGGVHYTATYRLASLHCGRARRNALLGAHGSVEFSGRYRKWSAAAGACSQLPVVVASELIDAAVLRLARAWYLCPRTRDRSPLSPPLTPFIQNGESVAGRSGAGLLSDVARPSQLDNNSCVILQTVFLLIL